MRIPFWKFFIFTGIALALSACSAPSPTPTSIPPTSTFPAPVKIDQPYIMFYSTRNNDAGWYYMKPDGTQVTRLMFPKLGGLKIAGLRWISGLKAFASELINTLGQSDLYVVDIDGNILSQVTKSGMGVGDEVYSDTARQFAFVCVQNDLDICVANPDGTNVIDVTPVLSRENNPQWDKTGKSIIFSSNKSGVIGIWSVNSDGTNMHILSGSHTTDDSQSFSPDGKLILFESKRDENYEIYTMNADGSNPTNLTKNPAADTDPKWSPNGEYIAFRSDRNSGHDLYVMKSDGSNVIDVTSTPTEQENDFVWSLDSQKIIYSAPNGNQGFDIFSVNRDGSQRVNLTNTPGDDVSPFWIGN